MESMEFPRPNGPVLTSEVVAELADGHKVKRRIGRMRACDETNEKGKPCHGHLKRWNGSAQYPEVYRCERCHTLYLPNEEEQPRTGILSW